MSDPSGMLYAMSQRTPSIQLDIGFGLSRPGRRARPDPGLRVAGLFAGIGGVERGLHAAGHHTALLCEIDGPAQRVLHAHFPKIPLVGDVRTIGALPPVDLITAGFPCQDLSQAGRTAGITGARSSLVGEVFRLMDHSRPRWLLLENVPFMLQLERGAAMRYLTDELDKRGYRWAYRVVDTRGFGLPQRRRRVLVLASPVEDPRQVLLADDAGPPPDHHVYSSKRRSRPMNDAACGFYWTEGTRGLGWAVDAIPTLKGGSSVGIPSPPAIVMPSGEIITPDIRDAERLQGFPARWTEPAVHDPRKRNGPRWRLIGNAVSVPVFRWVGERLRQPGDYDPGDDQPHDRARPWPTAAWSMGDGVHIARVSAWPMRRRRRRLGGFLRYDGAPLSLRATAGFRKRTASSRLRFPDGFLDVVDAHLARQKADAARSKTLA